MPANPFPVQCDLVERPGERGEEWDSDSQSTTIIPSNSYGRGAQGGPELIYFFLFEKVYDSRNKNNNF